MVLGVRFTLLRAITSAPHSTSARATSRLSAFEATCSGELPCSFTSLLEIPSLVSSTARSCEPLSAHACSRVLRSASIG